MPALLAEQIVGGYVREHPDFAALGAKLTGNSPSAKGQPWVRLVQLDAQNAGDSTPEHLLTYLLQFDCYAGFEAMSDDRGQREAWDLAFAVRSALDAGPQEADLDGAVFVRARFPGMTRVPDTDLDPAMERVVLTASVSLHAV